MTAGVEQGDNDNNAKTIEMMHDDVKGDEEELTV
jgi:hypothetical protein